MTDEHDGHLPVQETQNTSANSGQEQQREVAASVAEHVAMNDIDSVVLDEAAPNVPESVANEKSDARESWSGQGLDLASAQSTHVTTTDEQPMEADQSAWQEDDEAHELPVRQPRKANVAQVIDGGDTEVAQSSDTIVTDLAAESNNMFSEQASTAAAQSATDMNVDEPAEPNLSSAQCAELIKNLTFKALSIAQTIRSNTEPTAEVSSVAESLTQHGRDLAAAINSIKPALEQSEEAKMEDGGQGETLSENLASDMVQALKAMAQAMLDEQIIMSSDYLVAIFRFFRAVIVELYPTLMERLELCELVDLVLNDRLNLHQAIQPLPKASSSRRQLAGSKTQSQVSQQEKLRQELRTALDFEAERRIYEQIERQAAWRSSLKQGDLLDAQARFNTPNAQKLKYIRGWCPAMVLEVDDNTVRVGFLNHTSANNLNLEKAGEQIAPLGTYTDNVSWREELKEGVMIDACDDYAVWYRSTIARIYLAGNGQELDCTGNPVEMLHIVCRYPDPNGIKEKDGIKVTGWLKDEFDLHVEKASLSVRPFYGYSTQYYNVAPDDMKYDLEVADSEDVLFQSRKVAQYANHRATAYGGLKFVGTIFDDFGKAQGFEKILAFFEKVKAGSLKTSVVHIGLLVIFAARSLPFWSREYMCTNMERFVDSFTNAMSTKAATNPLNQPHTRGHINILINNYHMLLRRYYVPKCHQKMLNKMNSLIGCSLLRLDNLEKRIFGIKLISDQIGNLPYMEQTQKKKEEIVGDLMALNAFETIFSSKNYHQQILQRADDVLRLFAHTHSLTPEMIAILWETRQMDETACVCVYSIIGECVVGMQLEIVQCFVDKVRTISPPLMQPRDVELIYTIGKTNSHSSQARHCADSLWDIVFQQTLGYSKQVLKLARKKLTELIRFFETPAKVDFINRCIDQVSDPTVISLQVLKILFKTISWLPRHSSWANNNTVTMRSFVTELVTNEQLIDVLLQDLEAYKASAVDQWSPESSPDSTVFQARNIETFPLFAEGYTHEKNLEVRLGGIIYILEQTIIQGPRISAEQLQRLWTILLVQTKLPGDQRAFFRFFRRVLAERDWLDPRLVYQFFEEKIEQNHQVVNEISLDGFLSIQTMFLYINEFENSLNITKQPVEEKKSNDGQYGGKSLSSLSSSRRNKSSRAADKQQDWQKASALAKGQGVKQKLEFRVHKHPNELRGIEILWLLFQKSPSRDTELMTQVVSFLAQVYQSISLVLEDQRKQIFQDFIEESLRRLKGSLQTDDCVGVEKRDLVRNTMTMLVHSLADSEVSGSASIRPHLNIDANSRLLQELTVQSYLTREGKPKFFQFTVDGRLTVWEFQDFIAQKLGMSPCKIKLQRLSLKTMTSNTKQPEFTNLTHCSTLQELDVENGEEFTVMRNLNTLEKVPLTNPQNNQMVPDARIIFEAWFDTYAQPKEDFEDADQLTEAKYMDKKACVQFMASTVVNPRLTGSYLTETVAINEDSKEIVQLYAEYDTDQDGRLTKADFLKFYEHKCLASPQVVWQNLEKHNVGKDLKVGQASDLDLTYESDKSVLTDQRELPRYFMSANQQLFNSLFELEGLVGQTAPEHAEETMESVWQLIVRLKTNPQLYLSLLKNEDLDERLGQSNEGASSYRLLYSLSIIHGLMSNYRAKPESTVSLFYEGNKRPILGASGGVDYQKNFPSFEESKFNEGPKAPIQRKKPEPMMDEIMEDDNEIPMEFAPSATTGGAATSAKSNEAIALPDAATAEAQKSFFQSKSNQDRFGNQLTHSKRQIADWKGQVVHETIQVNQISDKELVQMLAQELEQRKDGQEELMVGSPEEWLEELKSKWLIDFIKNKGFEYLVSIIRRISSKHANSDKPDILKSKAEAITLGLATYLVKVILIACFCSQAEDSNLAGNLQRKMSMREGESHFTQSKNPAEPQNELVSKQKDLSDEFKQLTQIFSEDSDTASALLNSVDLNELQDLLQSTLRTVLKKQSLINELDRRVVAECLDIWVSCITFNSELLEKIYGDGGQSTEIVLMLIDQGLFSEMGSLRHQFREAIEFMCFNIKTGDLPTPPASFFLKQLLAKLGDAQRLSYQRTPDYFELLTKLLDHYFKARSFDEVAEILSPAALVKEVIGQLDEYGSQEHKTSVVADHTLVGLIDLARGLLQANPGILSQEECSKTMNLLIKKCLFNQTTNAYSGHVFNPRDLQGHESTQVNKCHTDASRNAAYALLDALISSNSDPTLIQGLVEGFWSTFIKQLDHRKEAGVAAQNPGRSIYSFAGLKNLGCICYMNSMLQQLYNVPSFRHSLLAADDREPEDLQQDSKGRQVDNNSLHQWLKMFSFLQLTDRQEYNPIDFCFAFKENNGSPTNVRVQQDAQEFLNLGFDRLEKLLKDTPQKYLCQNVFQGQMTSLTVCKDCGNIVCTDEDFYTLQATVKNQKTLQSSLESMIAGENIEDYNCGACNKKVTIEKKNCIKSLPNTLVVHLNRIVFDFDTMRNVKLNDKLDFPNELNVKQFMLHQVLADMRKNEDQSQASKAEAEPAAAQQEDASEERGAAQASGAGEEDLQMKEKREAENQRLQNLVKEGQKLEESCFDYKLVGVVIHMGVADAGHYISYINIEREADSSVDRAQWAQTDKQTWLEFNDSLVSPFDFSMMQFKAFGEEDTGSANIMDYSDVGTNAAQQSHNAYMLIYEKAEKKPLKVVCSPDHLSLVKAQPRCVIDAVSKSLSPQSNDHDRQPLTCDGTATPRDKNNKNSEIKQSNAPSNDSSTRAQAQAQVDTEMASQLSVEEQKQMDVFLEEVPHSFLIYPGLLNKLHSGDNQVLTYDKDSKEHYIEVPFHSVKSFVPNKYYKQVHSDNQLFLAEKQVFCAPFFRTSAQLMEQYLNSVDAENCLPSVSEAKREQVYSVIDKVIFEMLVNGTDDQQEHLESMTKLLFRIFDHSPHLLFKLVEERILMGIDEPEAPQQMIDTSKTEAQKKAKKLEDKVFLDLLIAGRTLKIRELAGQILSKVIIMLFYKLDSGEAMVDHQKIEEIIETVIRELLALIPGEVQKFWHKLGPFFEFFYSLVKDGNLRRVNYLIRVGLVKKFVDLTGRFNSSQEYSVPPFDKLVATVCTLARCQPLVIYLFGIQDQFQPTEAEVKAELQNVAISPQWIYSEIDETQALDSFNALSGQSIEDTKCLLLIDKKSKDFYNLALKNTQEAVSVARLIAHLCWNNFEVSRRFGKLILKGLNSTNEIEVKPFVECMKTYLALEDAYQEERVEWLLGIASWNMIKHQKPYGGNYINKVGVCTIGHIEDCIVEYTSTLFKTKTNYEESVLAMIYNYRKEKFVSASQAQLEGLTWVIANADSSHVLLKYLLTIDPPAYTSRRYWDWIEPHIQQIKKNYADAGAGASAELETCIRIVSNIELIKNKYGDLIAIPEQQAPLGDGGQQDRPVPESYLMWDIVNDSQIIKYPEAEDALVAVSIHECIIKVSKSRPTGSSNDSLERTINYSQKSTFVAKKQLKTRKSRSKTEKRGLGSKHRSAAAQSKKDKKKSRRGHRNQDRSEDSQEADQSDEALGTSQAEGVPTDTPPQNENPPVVPTVGEGAYPQSPASEPSDKPPIEEGQQQIITDGGDMQINMFDDKEPLLAPAEGQLPENSSASQDPHQEDVKEAEKPEKELENPYTLEEDSEGDKETFVEDPKTEQQTLLVFFINNLSRFNSKISIVFDQSKRHAVNYRQPATTYTEVFVANKSKIALKFAKLRLDEGWGDIYNFKIYIDDQEVTGLGGAGPMPKFDKDYHRIRAAKQPLIDAALAEAAANEMQDQWNENPLDQQDLYGTGTANVGGDGVPMGMATGGPADIDPADFGKINCPICTFLNDPNNPKCEVCGSDM